MISVFEQILHRAGLSPVAGADEAGRGACAGPLVAAAVILRVDNPIDALRDSKALSASARERLYPVIRRDALAVSTAIIEAGQCDQLGIQQANLLALRQAILGLEVEPGYVLTDGFHVDGLSSSSLGMWKADQVAACVSAASIVAKVTRDRIMDDVDSRYPGYEFSKHKGYATRLHQRLLDELGPCPQHRLSYANVAKVRRAAPTWVQEGFLLR